MFFRKLASVARRPCLQSRGTVLKSKSPAHYFRQFYIVQACSSRSKQQTPSEQKLSTVLLVESPTKAKKIQKYLGDEYEVLASYGHVRDLRPKQDSITPEEGFAMKWATFKNSEPRLNELRAAISSARRLLIATDPDREGEAIAWHVLEVLKGPTLKDKTVERITFTEVTKKAVTEAIRSPRQVSQELVDAYLARRALDFLVGFYISPVLWRKLPGARSAGRVQSVALRLLSEREAEIEAFKPVQYWTVEAALRTPDGRAFVAQLTEADGKKIGPRGFQRREEAEAVMERLRASSLRAEAPSSRSVARSPSPPFTTSTMQQEASRKLGLSASATMRAAQALYEGEGSEGEGLITYMRTDGVSISQGAIDEIRGLLEEEFGAEYLPEKLRVYKSKSKTAQEAHEAIRPVDVRNSPEGLPHSLDDVQQRLYRLIWRRAMASQAANALFEQIAVDFCDEGRTLVLRSTGRMLRFPGFLRVYGSDAGGDAQNDEDSDEGDGRGGQAEALSELKAGDPVSCAEGEQTGIIEHSTRPPPRFNEGSLIKAMEEMGIGRPSTYAPTMKLLKDRGYVVLEGRALVPSSKGRVLTAFLESFFSSYVDYGFTASLEAQLDEIAAGEVDWRKVLGDFWGPFSERVESAKDIAVTDVIDVLDAALGPHFFPTDAEGEDDPRRCPACDGSGRLGLKLSRLGGFIGCSNFGAEGINCKYVRPLSIRGNFPGVEGRRLTAEGHLLLGENPETGEEVTLRIGPYGPYLQMEAPGGHAAKRTSLPRGTDMSTLTLETALSLLRLPLEVGEHPEDGAQVMLHIGAYGFYVRHGDTVASLRKGMDPWDLDMERVVEILEAKRARMAKKQAKEAASGTERGKKSATQQKGKQSSSGKAKPADSPKRGPSAYILFTKENRQAVVENNPEYSFGDVAKALGAMWRELDEARKEEYRKRASQAAPTECPQEPSREPSLDAEQTGSASPGTARGRKKAAQQKGGSGKSSSGKETHAADSPKRGPSAYVLFSKENRQAIVESFPEYSFGDVARKLGAMWRNLDEAQKEKYRERAAQLSPREPAGAPR
uniref:DNA topoisomerase n=2 Tax=Tetraselmis sp. GSL018 TaxID=582737 RepID=A0A061RF57_9CHLO